MKKRSPTSVKITRPSSKGAYNRIRLFNLLEHARKQPIIWISGPPGCGKTILVASYLEVKESPCLWYQIDEGDADPATFFYYMGLAAKKAAPRKRKSLPLLTPEYLPGLPTFTLRYFENLFNRLKIPSFIVFDNYQEVPVESPFHEVIRQGLTNIPEGINVILISRGEPAPVFIRLQANNLMEVIDWQSLRLTLDESDDIVRLQTKHKVPQETLEYLHNATDGWLAGLMLMLKTAQRERLDPRELSTVPMEQIFDYFTGEIFDRIDSESQSFLLKSAFLPKMTASMAEGLTDFDFAGRVLSQLHRDQCFTMRHLQNPPTYEYHPLFRDFLLSRAEEKFSQDELSTLRQRSAVLLEQAGQTEAAIGLLRDTGDWEGMARLILKHAPTMLIQGRNRPMEEWLSSLPDGIFESIPWLFYWKGVCRLPFDPRQSQGYFEQAFERFNDQGDAAGIFLAWSGIVDSIIYASENYKPLDQWIDTFERLVEHFGIFPSEEIEARAASSMFLALTHRQSQHPDVEAWAERVLLLGEAHATLNAKVQTLSHLVRHQIFSGDIKKAALAMESLKQLSLSRDASPLSQILAKLAETLYCEVTGSNENCRNAISNGLELSKNTGVHVLDFILLGQAASAAFSENDSSAARNFLEQMSSSLGDRKPFDLWFYHIWKAREALILGDAKQAAYHTELVSMLHSKVGAPKTLAFHRLLQAYVMTELGEYRQATEHLADAFSWASRIKSTMFESFALLIEAKFFLDKENEASGLESLRKALAIMKKYGYINNFFDIPSNTADMYVKALEAGIEVDFVQDIIRKRKLIPKKPPVHLDNWPWAVQIFTLGRFGIERDGKPIQFSRKTQKPLTLLKTLIALGGKEVQQYRIADLLWPDADGDAAHSSFKMTLQRLRKLIGRHEALELKGGQLTIDERYCWVDILAFDRMLVEADTAWKKAPNKKDLEKAIVLTQKALGLYQGHFLEAETGEPWTVSLRENIRSNFLLSVIKLGTYWERVEQWEKALECYQGGVKIDDLAEEFYRGLMVCYKQIGRKSDALATYDRCQKILFAALGVKPSQEIETLRESLLAE